jgi:hypothetical protein
VTVGLRFETEQLTLLILAVAALMPTALLIDSQSVSSSSLTLSHQQHAFNAARFDRERVLQAANQYLSKAPITITAFSSQRSAGGVHDFFSEGDYWWPDPQNPDGPYIQRDGMSNPGNFTDHLRYLVRLGVEVPALAAA